MRKHPTSELLSLTADTPAGSFLLAVLYRPPGLDRDFSALDSALQSLDLADASNVLIVGGFNVDMSNSSSAVAMDLHAVITGYGLKQRVEAPTRFQGSSSTLLDLVLSTSEHLLNSCSVLPPLGSSDHQSLEACLRLTKPRPTKAVDCFGYTRRPISRLSMSSWMSPYPLWHSMPLQALLMRRGHPLSQASCPPWRILFPLAGSATSVANHLGSPRWLESV